MISKINFPVSAVDFASIISSKSLDGEECYFDKELAKKFKVDIVVGTALELGSIRNQYQMSDFSNEEYALDLSTKSYRESNPQGLNTISQLQISVNTSPQLVLSILNGYNPAVLNGCMTILIEIIEDNFVITREMVNTSYPILERSELNEPVLAPKAKKLRGCSVGRGRLKSLIMIGNHLVSLFCLVAIVLFICHPDVPIGNDKSSQTTQGKTQIAVSSKNG